jgi:NitT/TauT family transport system substrate-binding protein
VIGTSPTRAGLAVAHRLCCCALVIFACVLSSSCSPRVAHPAPLTIKLGDFLWPGTYWVDVAWKKGWFQAAGLDVELVNVDYKYFSALDDVVEGRLDAIGFSQFDLVRHVAAGHDLVGIAALDYSEGAEALVAHPGTQHLRDLKGKRLSLHRGTYLEFLLAIVAEREGFNLADLTLVDQPGEIAIEDFKAGRVDAVLVWEPYVSEALASGGVSLFSAADFPGLTYSVLSMRHEFIQQHPQEVAAMVRVWHQAEVFIRDHPHEACGIVGEHLGYSVEEVEALMKTVRIVDLADNGRAFSYAAGFESLHGSWRRMNDYMLERGLATARAESSEHLDSGFIRRLE